MNRLMTAALAAGVALAPIAAQAQYCPRPAMRHVHYRAPVYRAAPVYAAPSYNPGLIPSIAGGVAGAAGALVGGAVGAAQATGHFLFGGGYYAGMRSGCWLWTGDQWVWACN